MNTEIRRMKVLNKLEESSAPITGSELAKDMGVSRQVIVQDIAVLRAKGKNIIATSNGYCIEVINGSYRNIKTIVCSHEGYESLEEELSILIDMGAKVLDVIVDHPIYGEIRCPLMINSRYELDKFLGRIRNKQAEPLSSLTGGEHIHTIDVPSDMVFKIITSKLKEKGYIKNKD